MSQVSERYEWDMTHMNMGTIINMNMCTTILYIYHLAASANESGVREIRMSQVSERYESDTHSYLRMSQARRDTNQTSLIRIYECVMSQKIRMQPDSFVSTHELCLREIRMRHDSFVSTHESCLREIRMIHDSFDFRRIRMSYVSYEYGNLLLQLLLGVKKIQTWREIRMSHDSFVSFWDVTHS